MEIRPPKVECKALPLRVLKEVWLATQERLLSITAKEVLSATLPLVVKFDF